MPERYISITLDFLFYPELCLKDSFTVNVTAIKISKMSTFEENYREEKTYKHRYEKLWNHFMCVNERQYQLFPLRIP